VYFPRPAGAFFGILLLLHRFASPFCSFIRVILLIIIIIVILIPFCFRDPPGEPPRSASVLGRSNMKNTVKTPMHGNERYAVAISLPLTVVLHGETNERAWCCPLNACEPPAQDLTITRWEDLDMRYSLGYVNEHAGINISFKAKFVLARDINADGSVIAAPVRKADHSELFKGDDPSNSPLEIRCLFQEG
jgi:hypothetical protein